MAIKTASNSQWQNLATRVKDIDDLHSPLVPGSRDKAIPANADLNTPEYLAIGTYYCASSNTGSTLVNAPAKTALSMRVYNPISTQKGSETTVSWVYRYREVICLNGDVYKQSVTSGSTPNQFTYGAWRKVIANNDLKTINSTSIVGSGNISVQPTLESGTNIKTVGGTSLLGSGDVPFPTIDSALSSSSTNAVQNKVVNSALSGKQATLVSGTNIKTVGGTSLLGSGNIAFPTVDSALSSTSTNAVQNKVINSALGGKQATLVSGTNIKTVNSTSLLGEGNISVQPTLVSGTNIKTVGGTSLLGSGNIAFPTVDSALSSTSTNAVQNKVINTALGGKQAKLVSGTNIKTVNSTSLLGSGNVAVQPTLVSGTNIKTVNNTSLLGSGNVAVQPTLVSGTNIKTVNGNSLLGSGNVSIESGGIPVFNCSRLTSKDTTTEVAVKVDLAGKTLTAGTLCIFNFTESVRVSKKMKVYFYNGSTDTGVTSTPYINRIHYIYWNPDQVVWVNSGKNVLMFISSVSSTDATSEVIQANIVGNKRSGFSTAVMDNFNTAINNVKWLTINTNGDSSFNSGIKWGKYNSSATKSDTLVAPDGGTTRASLRCRILGTWSGVIRVHFQFYSTWQGSPTTVNTIYVDTYKPSGIFYLQTPTVTDYYQNVRVGMQAVGNSSALEVDGINFVVDYDYSTGLLD